MKEDIVLGIAEDTDKSVCFREKQKQVIEWVATSSWASNHEGYLRITESDLSIAVRDATPAR